MTNDHVALIMPPSPRKMQRIILCCNGSHGGMFQDLPLPAGERKDEGVQPEAEVQRVCPDAAPGKYGPVIVSDFLSPALTFSNFFLPHASSYSYDLHPAALPFPIRPFSPSLPSLLFAISPFPLHFLSLDDRVLAFTLANFNPFPPKHI